MEGIIAAIITGVLTLIGTVITVLSVHKKTEHALEVAQAVTDTKLEELTREVRAHNGFAQKIPIIETRLDNIVYRLDKLEGDGK